MLMCVNIVLLYLVITFMYSVLFITFIQSMVHKVFIPDMAKLADELYEKLNNVNTDNKTE